MTGEGPDVDPSLTRRSRSTAATKGSSLLLSSLLPLARNCWVRSGWEPRRCDDDCPGREEVDGRSSTRTREAREVQQLAEKSSAGALVEHQSLRNLAAEAQTYPSLLLSGSIILNAHYTPLHLRLHRRQDPKDSRPALGNLAENDVGRGRSKVVEISEQSCLGDKVGRRLEGRFEEGGRVVGETGSVERLVGSLARLRYSESSLATGSRNRGTSDAPCSRQ